MPRTRPAIVTALRSRSAPVVTYALIALCVVVYGLQQLPGTPGDLINIYGTYRPQYTAELPWTMITSMFMHASILHIGLNMLSLYLFGSVLERVIGRGRFLVLYLVSGFGGSVAVLLLAPTTAVVGASGAIFGVLGAFFIVQRGLGGNNASLLVIIGLNLVIGFLPGTNIAWQAHLGGLVVGAAVAFVYIRTRRADQRTAQILGVAAIVVGLLALTVALVFLR